MYKIIFYCESCVLWGIYALSLIQCYKNVRSFPHRQYFEYVFLKTDFERIYNLIHIN